jgi:WD40 repeat protein
VAIGKTFDVFLSYSRADAEATRQVQSRLTEAGVATFLDRDQLPAGQPWLPALEQAIAACGAIVVLVGPAGLGTWQRREVQLALDRQAENERAGRTLPVIPVLLPKVADPPGGFLRLQTWVDLRADLADPAQMQLLLSGIRGDAPADGTTSQADFCPYRGLLPFREEDAGLFFGREKETSELVGKLREHSFVTVVGRSGSGKSSIVYAGLIPALRRRADGRTWSILSLRPGPQPLHALVAAFDPPPPDLPPFEADQRVEKQVEILRTEEGALGRRVRSLLASPDERGTDRLLLHVDQWEELYSQALRSSVSTPKQAEADVARFIDLVLDAAQTSPCTVVLTVRADFYGELLKHGALAATVPPGLVNLGPMSRAGLAAAIQGPAMAVGLTVDPLLLQELLDEVSDDLGKLPLLEYALKETWLRREGKRLTLNAYGQAGRIDGAVAKRANEIFAHLKPAEQSAARRLFVSLVSPGEGREDTRARALYPEEDEAIRAVVREFSGPDARLLVTGEDVPAARRLVEISHEALIREWDMLRQWIGANRETLRRREYIRGRMRQWEEEGRDETLLLSPGLPIEDGRKLLVDHGDVLIQEVEPYIKASIAADDERQRRELAAATEQAEVARQLAEKRARLAQAARRSYALAAVFLLVVGVGAGVFGVLQTQAEREAARERDAAEKQLLESQIARSRLLAKLSQDRTTSGDATAGMLLALEALPADETDKRPIIFEAVAALTQASLDMRERAVLRQWAGISGGSIPGAGFHGIAFSPDGRTLVIASLDGTARLWDVDTGQERSSLDHKSFIESVAFSPDGRTLATASRDSNARLWDVATGQQRTALPHRTVYVRGAVFSPDGRILATKSDEYGSPPLYLVRLWDAATGTEFAVLEHPDFVNSIAFSPNSRTIATGSTKGTARLWDSGTGKESFVLRHSGAVSNIAFSPDGHHVATASRDSTARVWDAATGEERAVLRHPRAVNNVTFSPDSRTLVTGSDDGTARLWDWVTGEERAVLGHQGPVAAVMLSPDGYTIATASKDGTARVWDAATGEPRAVLRHPLPLHTVAFSPDGRVLATASEDGTARLWNIAGANERPLIRYERAMYAFATSPDGRTQAIALSDKSVRFLDLPTGHERPVRIADAVLGNMVLSPDGRILAASDRTQRSKVVRLWDSATGEERAVLAHGCQVNAISFSPDGRVLATGCLSEEARLWDIQTGQQLALLSHPDGIVVAVAFSPDGRTVATGTMGWSEGTTRLWNAATGEERTAARSGTVNALTFSLDGGILAGASDDRTVRLWDAGTGEERAVLEHPVRVDGVIFSPDGRSIATSSVDGTARLWDLATGRERLVLRHRDEIWKLVFSLDGRTLATASRDGYARLWDVDTGQQRAVLRYEGKVADIAFLPDGRTAVTQTSNAVWLVILPPTDVSELAATARARLPVGRTELTKEELDEAPAPAVQPRARAVP